jgi:hypothetical protein
MPVHSDLTGQDFVPVVIRRPRGENKNQPRASAARARDAEEDARPPEKMSRAQVRTLQAHRVAAGFGSQKDLARATNGKISQARVAELENGKGAAPTGAEKNLLFRLIKMKFQ